MKENKDITRGGLAGKMSGFTPEPPASVWEGVQGSLDSGKPRRRLFILLSVAAGILLAMSVGVPLLFNDGKTGTESQIAQESIYPETESATDDNQEEVIITATDQGSDEMQQMKARKEENPGTTVKENRSRLERKVIETMHEMEPAQMALIDQAGEEERIVVADNTEATISDLQDTEIQETNVNQQLQQIADSAEVAEEKTEINEDSLLNLLKPDPIENDETIPEAKSRGKWQIGASISPQVSYRDVASSDIFQNMKVNNSESAKLTYAGGIRLNYSATKRLSVESGIYYNQMGVNIGDYRNFSYARYQEMDYAPTANSNNVVSISNSMGSVVTKDEALFLSDYAANEAIADYHMLQPNELLVNETSVDGFTQTFEFLEVPFNLKFLLIDRSLQVQLVGGISTNFLVSNTFNAATAAGLEEIGRVDNVNWVNYSGNAGIGFAYEIFQNFSFNLEPRFRYYLNSINTPELPVTRPYTFGVRTGVSYAF